MAFTIAHLLVSSHLLLYWLIDGQVFFFLCRRQWKQVFAPRRCYEACCPVDWCCRCTCPELLKFLFEPVATRSWWLRFFSCHQSSRTVFFLLFWSLSRTVRVIRKKNRIYLNSICECKHKEEKNLMPGILAHPCCQAPAENGFSQSTGAIKSCPLDQLAATGISCQWNIWLFRCDRGSREVECQRNTPFHSTLTPRESIYSLCSSYPTLLKVTDSQTWENLYDLTVSILGLASCTVELSHCVRCAVRARRPAKTSSRLAWHGLWRRSQYVFPAVIFSLINLESMFVSNDTARRIKLWVGTHGRLLAAMSSSPVFQRCQRQKFSPASSSLKHSCVTLLLFINICILSRHCRLASWFLRI